MGVQEEKCRVAGRNCQIINKQKEEVRVGLLAFGTIVVREEVASFCTSLYSCSTQN